MNGKERKKNSDTSRAGVGVNNEGSVGSVVSEKGHGKHNADKKDKQLRKDVVSEEMSNNSVAPVKRLKDHSVEPNTKTKGKQKPTPVTESGEVSSLSVSTKVIRQKRSVDEEKKNKRQQKDVVSSNALDELSASSVETINKRKELCMDEGRKKRGRREDFSTNHDSEKFTKEKDVANNKKKDHVKVSAHFKEDARVHENVKTLEHENVKTLEYENVKTLELSTPIGSVESINKKNVHKKRQKRPFSIARMKSGSEVNMNSRPSQEEKPIKCKKEEPCVSSRYTCLQLPVESEEEKPRKLKRYMCTEQIDPCREGPPEFICESMPPSSDDERAVELREDRNERKKRLRYMCIDHGIKTKSRSKHNNEAPVVFVRRPETADLPDEEEPSNCKCVPSKKIRQRGGSQYNEKAEINIVSKSQTKQNKKVGKSFFSRLFGWSRSSPNSNKILNVVETTKVSEKTIVHTNLSSTTARTQGLVVASNANMPESINEEKKNTDEVPLGEKPQATTNPVKESQQ